MRKISSRVFFILGLISCQPEAKKNATMIKQLDPVQTAREAAAIEATVSPKLAEGLTLKLWGVDSLVADPVSIDVDDQGSLYYTRTNRQKNSEFDIRGHQDWEIQSIQVQNIEEKRAFLRKVLSPENSRKNTWLPDLNKDSLHDWRDMTIEKEQVFRVEDVSGDGIADASQLVVEDFHEEVTDAAGGILKHGNDLFVAIGPDLWKLNDPDGDGAADVKVSLSHGYGVHVGFSGHGMSGVEVGPEGRIYWQIGDIGFSGTGPDGQKWEHPNNGVIVRANPDGSDFEVFAYGNRNTHEFVFDEYANLISVDNDGDHPGESERLVYIVNGGDSGWRINWQFGKYRDQDNNTYKVWMDEKMYVPRFEGQAAYFIAPIINYVNGPTGMLYNPGTALGRAWRNTFFVAEFVGNPSRSGIHAFKLKPKGATFELAETQLILGGILATGLDFGPDGAMYVADWVDGWNTKNYGRVWKLDVAEVNQGERSQTKMLLAVDFGKYEVSQLGNLLRDPDMRVRQKAQFELATRGQDGLEIFTKSIAQTAHQLARVHGIWGISQFARKEAANAELLLPLLADKDPEIRAQAAKWLGDVRYKEAGDELVPLLRDDYSRARFFAAEALGRIAFEPAINPIVDLLEANNDEDAYIRHAGSLALARIGKSAPIAALSSHKSRAVRIAAVVALRRMREPAVSEFLKDPDEFIVTEAARAINDDLSIEQALPALSDLLMSTNFKGEALLRRAINANLRVGTEQSMMNLAGYAEKQGAPIAMRAEAVAALGTWSRPSVVDRVDGRYRGEITRDPKIAQGRSREMLIRMLAHPESLLRLAAIAAVTKLGIEASAQLYIRVRSDPDPAVRVACLRSLAITGSERSGAAIQLALSDKERSVRIAGLDLLTKVEMPGATMVSMLSSVIATRTVEERQAAVLTLGRAPLEHSRKVFDQLLAQMQSGKLAPEIQLELSEAIDSTRSQDLRSQFDRVSSVVSPDSLFVAYSSTLVGGDLERGRRIFYRNQTAQCIRCHAYDDYGGNAGPRLNGVASRLSRKQLLESLIDPGARIAPGFGTVALELANGRTISGILQEERPSALVLKIGDRPDTLIQATDIRTRTDGSSSMPPMSYLLTKREIRDLVSFLATLQEE